MKLYSFIALAVACLSCATPNDSLGLASTTEALQVAKPSFQYDYLSVVPNAPPVVGDKRSLLRPAPVLPAKDIAARLGTALSLGRGLDVLQSDAARGITRFKNGNHILEVAEHSGSIHYSNVALYNGNGEKMPPDDAQAKALATKLIILLEQQQLITSSEVLWNAPDIYHMYSQDAVGGSPLGAPVAPSPPRAVDTRIRYHRLVNGVPVSGSFIRVVFSDTQEVADLRLHWRPVSADPPGMAKSVVKTHAQARAAFEASQDVAQLSPGAEVRVLVDEFVYADGNRYDAVNFLEPGYVFLYSVRTPIADDPGRFVIGKQVTQFIPATDNAEKQLPSAEAARYSRINVQADSQQPMFR